jgi:hypothetical protein
MSRLRWWLCAGVVGLALAAGGTAMASWIVTINSGSNYAAAAAQTLPTGATPTATVAPASNQTVSLSFTKGTTSGGTAVTTYNVTRYAVGSGSGTAISGSCAIVSSTVTCTDAPGSGSWQYTDTPAIASSSWVGTESAKSIAVVVQALTTTTVAVTASVTVNTAITPSATLAGATTSPAPTGSISFSVFGPQASAPSSCTGAGWSAVGTAVTITANGGYNAGAAFTPTVAGTYWWEASYNGDTYNAGSSSTCASNSTVVHLALSPSSLLAATVYTAYSQTITASGGTSPYTFAVTSGAQPTGLTLSSAGVLSGTISASGQSGTFTFTVTATDHVGLTGSTAYSLTVNAPTIALAALSPANPTGETTWAAATTASGGQGTYSYALTSGALPTGLSLNTATGGFTGTETGPGTFTFGITATDGNGYTGSQSYTVTVISPTISLAALSPANPTGETTWAATAGASGGQATYSYALTSGALPTGLSLNTATGGFTGTETGPGTFTFTITATDGHNFTGAQAYTVTVISPVSLAALSPANPTGETTWAATANAVGGIAPYTYALTSGALPTGLSLNTSTGGFTGTETGPGTFTFTITATDSHSFTGARSYTVTVISPTITLSPSTLPVGIATQAYTQTLSSSGGVSPYTYAVTSGTLPGTIALSSAGVFSGSASAGTTSITVTATDHDGFASVGKSYSLVIVPILGETLLGSGTNTCGLVLVGSCTATKSVTTTTGATELVLAYFTTSVSLSSASGTLSGSPFTNVTAVTTNQYSSGGELFAWTATGTNGTGTASVAVNAGLASTGNTVTFDVIQLTGVSSSTPVAQSTAKTGTMPPNSGTTSAGSSTFGSAPSAGDGSIIIIGSFGTPSTLLSPPGTAIDNNSSFGIFMFDPAATTESYPYTTAQTWGSIGIEFNHG